MTRSVCTDEFKIHEIVHDAGTAIVNHGHRLAQICTVLQGTFTEAVEGRVKTYGRGVTVLRPPGACHQNLGGPGRSRAIVIELSDGVYSRFARLFPEGPMPFEAGPEITREIIAAIAGELETADSASALALRGLVFQLLARLARAASPEARSRLPDWVVRAHQLLNVSFRQPLSLRDLADAVGVHPTKLAREYRRRYGRSVGEQIRSLRMQCAIEGLLSGRLTIAEIAARSGFTDQAYFAREFKKETGRTPSEFRASPRFDGATSR